MFFQSHWIIPCSDPSDSLVITLGAAAQVGLFIETGGELRWSMLGKIIREPQGFMGMLLTGVMSTAAFTTVLAVVSYVLNPSLYNLTGRVIDHCYTAIVPRRCPNGEYHLVAEDGETEDVEASPIWARIRLAAVISVVFVLHILRPAQPFNHMTGTLPFTMFEAIFSLEVRCAIQPRRADQGTFQRQISFERSYGFRQRRQIVDGSRVRRGGRSHENDRHGYPRSQICPALRNGIGGRVFSCLQL